MKRLVALLMLVASPALAQVAQLQGGAQRADGSPVALEPSAIFVLSCNGGLGGFVGQTYSAVVCSLPSTASGGGGGSVTQGTSPWVDVITPTASPLYALPSSTVAGVSSDVLKNSAGNVYSLNLVNGTTAGFVVLYDATAAPTSGTALTTGLIRYCFPVAASAGFDKVFQMPMQMTNGATELFSTSCTTYTAPATSPVILTGQVK